MPLETVVTLEMRVNDLQTMLDNIEKAPESVSIEGVLARSNELDVIVEFVRREDIQQRIAWLKSRILGHMMTQMIVLKRMAAPDPYQVPEIRDYRVRGVFRCGECKKVTDMAVRIARTHKPIKTFSRCLRCDHMQSILINPPQADAVIRTGKPIDLEYIRAKKRKTNATREVDLA